MTEVATEAAQGDVCQAANDNDPGQVVVSGHKAAVERAVDIAKARGAKRVAAGQHLQVLVVEAVLAEAAGERRLEPREVLRLAGLHFFSACSEAT